jgi:hypothetical protein
MPTVVWSHNTTVCRATNFTPFRLMYRDKAVLSEEIKHQSLRTTTETIACPNEAEEKDQLELDRLKAVVDLEKYQEERRAWRNPKVQRQEFEAKWTGLYVVTEKMRPGAYRLSNTQG